MQTRTITVDYARPRGYDVGYRAENNFTLLALPVPEELEGADSYRVYFESTVGEYLQTELLAPTDGYVTVKITSDIVSEPGNMAAQLVAFRAGEIVGYAPMITGTAKVSIPDGTERLSHSLAAEIALNTAARHTHDNKGTLDKLSASDGILTYDGKSVDGSKDFIIQMAVNDAGELVSCKTTFEQVDAAYKAGKNPIVQATVSTSDGDAVYLLSLTAAVPNEAYAFGLINYMSTVYATITSPDIDPDSEWQYDERDFGKELKDLSKKSHTHDNKDTLDKLSGSNGKLQYNGSDVGLKGDKGDTGATGADGKTPIKGVDYWTAADKQEIIDDIHPVFYIDLAGEYPNYTCPVAMDDIKTAYNSGYNLVCRCTLGVYTATLPLFIPMPAANTWIFSGSGALKSMGFNAQSFTVAITASGVVAQNKELVTPDGTLPNPSDLTLTVGDTTYTYDGSEAVSVAVKPPTQSVTTSDGNITLIDNTEYRLTDVSTLDLIYPSSDFECWMRLSFAKSGNVTVTLPAYTKYIGTAPDFKNGETWELSFKDGVLAAQKVGEGT